MGIVQTGTVCPFPYTFPPSLNSSSDSNLTLTIANCTETYAQALAPQGFYAIKYTTMAFALLFIVLYSYRLWQLHRYASRVLRQRVTEMTQFKFYAIGLAGSWFLFIESLDMFAFEHVMPKEIYFLCDELVVATLYFMTIFTVDFWAMLALSTRVNSRAGLPAMEKRAYLFFSAFNFPGFVTIGMIDYNQYFVFEGVKMMVGAAILTVFMIRGYLFIRQIQATFMHAEQNAGSGKRTLAIQVFRRKFTIFSCVLVIGVLGEIYNGLAAWGVFNSPGQPVDLAWAYPINQQPDPVQPFLKAIFVCAFTMILYFFRVPKSEPVVANSSNSSSRVAAAEQGHVLVANIRTMHGPGSQKLSPRVTGEVTSFKTDHQQNVSDRDREISMSDLHVMSLKTLLQDPIQRDKFADFIEKKYASESLKFYEAGLEYAEITDQAEREKKGKAIIKSYFADNAVNSITVRDQVRRKILAEKEFKPDTFKPAMRETFEVLYSNFYHSYMATHSSLNLVYNTT